jgi:hypothetical protein
MPFQPPNSDRYCSNASRYQPEKLSDQGNLEKIV